MLPVDSPGWVALRIPPDAGKNELDRELFAHTSPVYLDMDGQRIFRPEIVKELIAEIQDNVQVIEAKGTFANEDEREAVLRVHRAGILRLERSLKDLSFVNRQ